MNNEFKNNTKRLISISLISFLIGQGIAKGVETFFYKSNNYNNKLTITEEDKDKLYSLLEEETELEITDDNDNILVLSGVVDNPNLSESEKETIYKLVDVIKENPYLDKRSAYENLKNLDIVYTTKDKDDKSTYTGIYYRNENKIEVFNEEDKNDILIHELIHCLFTNNNTYKLPEYLVEGVTELLVDEYYSDNPYIEINSYPYQIAATKILCDMVGSNKVLEAYTTGNMGLIEDSLNKTMDKKETKKFLNNMDTMFKEYNKEGKSSLEPMSEFLEYANTYMDKKYPDGSEVLNSYEYNKEMLILMKNEQPDIEYMFYVNINGYYIKPYFSKKLKQEDTKHYQKSIKKNPFKYKLVGDM